MPTIQATTIGGNLVTNATWKVKSLGGISVGEGLRVNVVFEDEKLLRFLAKTTAQECVLEREEKDGGEGASVTLGFIVEKFTHLLDDSQAEPDIESMAWLKPMNRTVEAVIQYLFDRDGSDPKFLAAIGAKRGAESADA